MVPDMLGSMLFAYCHVLTSGVLLQVLTLSSLLDLGLAICSGWHQIPLYHPPWPYAA